MSIPEFPAVATPQASSVAPAATVPAAVLALRSAKIRAIIWSVKLSSISANRVPSRGPSTRSRRRASMPSRTAPLPSAGLGTASRSSMPTRGTAGKPPKAVPAFSTSWRNSVSTTLASSSARMPAAWPAPIRTGLRWCACAVCSAPCWPTTMVCTTRPISTIAYCWGWKAPSHKARRITQRFPGAWLWIVPNRESGLRTRPIRS